MTNKKHEEKIASEGATLEEILEDVQRLVKKADKNDKFAKKILESAREKWECSVQYGS